MPLNESNVVERARRLLVCTIDAANFSDKMDIIFVAEMIEKIGKFVEKFKDVSGRTSLLKDVLQACHPSPGRFLYRWTGQMHKLLHSCLLSRC